VAPRSLQDAFSLFSAVPTPQFFIPVLEDAALPGVVDIAGRLAPGVSRTQAQADFSRIAAQLSVEKKAPAFASVERSDLPPSRVLGDLATFAALFLVVVFTILLIACDDIAIVLLARIAARQREMGIRVALGGTRVQLIRQLISENILLSILGGAGAMIFMLLASRLIERLPVQLPDTSKAVFDWRVLVFTILTSLAATLFFGLRPALQGINRDVVASLSPGSKTSGRRQGRVRAKLIVGQIAVCTALLITAAVATRAVQGQVFVERGFKTDHLLVADLNFTGAPYDRDSQFAFYRQLLPRLTAAPGIESVSIINNSGFVDGSNDTVQTGAANVSLPMTTMVIDGEYFRTLQVPLRAGRNFNEQDDLNSAPVGIISQKLARVFPPAESPIGRRIRTGNGGSIEIVGVVPDIGHRGDVRFAKPVLYRPLNQTQRALISTVTLMVKFSGTAAAAGRIIHDKVSELDPSLLVYNVKTLDDPRAERLLAARIIVYAIGIPGLFTLLLGIVGTYGTMAILVAQRRQEVGIRIALGAQPSTAVRAILGEGIRSVSIGVGWGLAAVTIIVLWLSRNIGEVEFWDPIAFVSMTLLVIITAGAACYIPARRASRIDPMIVLRED
jgi:predicted permease